MAYPAFDMTERKGHMSSIAKRSFIVVIRKNFPGTLSGLLFGLLIVLGVFSFSPRLQAEEIVDLSGTWLFRFDPMEYGEEKGWYETSATTWNTMQVPMSFNAGDNSWYSGMGWYRTSFKVPVSWDEDHIFLKFLAVNHRCKIWVNGEMVGENNFPYLPFEINITDHVIAGRENRLVVQVDNRILAGGFPDKNWDGWWNYGGIIREVQLIRRPQIYTKDVIINTQLLPDSTWRLDLLLDTYNLGNQVTGNFEVAVLDQEGRELWSGIGNRQIPGGRTQYSFMMRMEDIRPWSPQSPELYDLRVITSMGAYNWEDEKIFRFGFRDVEIRGTQFFLNGEPLTIKGISRHEMYPGSGMTLTEDQMRADLRDIKELGCNLIRTAHYTQHPLFYDLADEMGFLVWTEIPAWKTSTEVLTNWRIWEFSLKPQFESMIEYYRRHPSIVIWSVGNEFQSDTEQGALYVERATNYIRGLDPTRLVTFASDQYMSDMQDTSFQFVDFIAINEYYGWENGTNQDVGPTLDQIHQQWPDKPILVSGAGTGSLMSIHNPNPVGNEKDYSVEHQSFYLRTHLNQIYDSSRRDFVSGAIVWYYNDFPDPARVGNGHPPENNYINSKGLVTQTRQRKPAFEVVKEIFRNLNN